MDAVRAPRAWVADALGLIEISDGDTDNESAPSALHVVETAVPAGATRAAQTRKRARSPVPRPPPTPASVRKNRVRTAEALARKPEKEAKKKENRRLAEKRRKERRAAEKSAMG